MKRQLKQADACAWPARPKNSVPKLMELPERVIGCTYAAHGNSSARAGGRTALSMHRSVADKTTLFNVHAPVLFHDAKLVINQTAAKKSVKDTKVQVVTWPKERACAQDADCNTDKQETCKLPAGKAKGKCASLRPTKAPMGYVVGKVAPDDGRARARSIAFWRGELRDGIWTPAKFVDTSCPDFPRNQAACPAVTSAKVVRFFPNFADGKAPQPFTVTLEGDKQRRRKPRAGGSRSLAGLRIEKQRKGGVAYGERGAALRQSAAYVVVDDQGGSPLAIIENESMGRRRDATAWIVKTPEGARARRIYPLPFRTLDAAKAWVAANESTVRRVAG